MSIANFLYTETRFSESPSKNQGWFEKLGTSWIWEQNYRPFSRELAIWEILFELSEDQEIKILLYFNFR